MDSRVLNEILEKKNNKESQIYDKNIRISIGNCVKRIMAAEGVSEEAAVLLAANAIEYGDIEAKVDELLHGNHDDDEYEEDEGEQEQKRQHEAYKKAKAVNEIMSGKYAEAPLYDWTVDVGINEMIDSVAKREHLSKDAARILVSNALRGVAAQNIMECYCHWVMTGHKELPD